MTIYSCSVCSGVHNSMDPQCPQIVTAATSTYVAIAGPADPKSVGTAIRALLFSLRAPTHTEAEERDGLNSYDTDELRAEALVHAGICFVRLGRMGPGCACEWSQDSPNGPREVHAIRMKQAMAYMELGAMVSQIKVVRENLRFFMRAINSLVGAVWATQAGVDAKLFLVYLEQLSEMIEVVLKPSAG